jgi:3-keto-disaccharide hydrolase
MDRQTSGIVMAAALVAVGGAVLSLHGQTPAPAPQGQPPRALTEEQIAKPAPIPDGFTPIFNGKDLTGWHVSKTNSHGTTPDYHVMHGMIVGTQQPMGEGGILLTDRKYRNFEVFMEVKPDWGCDSGLFLRASEAGQAYQVMMDYLPGGTMGGVYGEGLQGVSGKNAINAQEAWPKAWRREEWNTVRARIEGDVPHIMVWINDQLVTDFTDSANHAAGGATDGMIAIQVHRNGENNGVPYMRWVPGGFWRWRTIAVKELP